MLAIQAKREPANAGGADHDAALSISSSLYKGEVLASAGEPLFDAVVKKPRKGLEQSPTRQLETASWLS